MLIKKQKKIWRLEFKIGYKQRLQKVKFFSHFFLYSYQHLFTIKLTHKNTYQHKDSYKL